MNRCYQQDTNVSYKMIFRFPSDKKFTCMIPFLFFTILSLYIYSVLLYSFLYESYIKKKYYSFMENQQTISSMSSISFSYQMEVCKQALQYKLRNKSFPSQLAYQYKKVQLLFLFYNNFKGFDKQCFPPLNSINEVYCNKAPMSHYMDWMGISSKDLTKEEAVFLKESFALFQKEEKDILLHFQFINIFINDQVNLLEQFRQFNKTSFWSYLCIWAAASCTSVKCINFVMEDMRANKCEKYLCYCINEMLFQSILSSPHTKANVFNFLRTQSFVPTVNQYCDNFMVMDLPLLEAVYTLYEETVFSLPVCQALCFIVKKYKQPEKYVYVLLHTIKHIIKAKEAACIDYMKEEEDDAFLEKRDMVDCLSTFLATKQTYSLLDKRVCKDFIACRAMTDLQCYLDLLYDLNKQMANGFQPDMTNCIWQQLFRILSHSLDLKLTNSSLHMRNMKHILKHIQKHEQRNKKVQEILYERCPEDISLSIQQYCGWYY